MNIKDQTSIRADLLQDDSDEPVTVTVNFKKNSITLPAKRKDALYIIDNIEKDITAMVNLLKQLPCHELDRVLTVMENQVELRKNDNEKENESLWEDNLTEKK